MYTNNEFKSENKLFIRKFNEYFSNVNLKEEELSKEYFDNIFIHDKSINFKDYFKDLNDLTECVVDDFFNGINVEAMFIS